MDDMRVNFREVELAGEQENHGVDGCEVSVPSRPPFGRLEEAVEGFQEAVGLPGTRPGDDAVEVLADHPGHLLHGFDLGTHDICAPLPEHSGDHIDLLAFQNFPQLFTVQPGPRRAPAGQFCQQGIDFGPVRRGQAVVVPQQLPAQPLEVRCTVLL